MTRSSELVSIRSYISYLRSLDRDSFRDSSTELITKQFQYLEDELDIRIESLKACFDKLVESVDFNSESRVVIKKLQMDRTYIGRFAYPPAEILTVIRRRCDSIWDEPFISVEEFFDTFPIAEIPMCSASFNTLLTGTCGDLTLRTIINKSCPLENSDVMMHMSYPDNFSITNLTTQEVLFRIEHKSKIVSSKCALGRSSDLNLILTSTAEPEGYFNHTVITVNLDRESVEEVRVLKDHIIRSRRQFDSDTLFTHGDDRFDYFKVNDRRFVFYIVPSSCGSASTALVRMIEYVLDCPRVVAQQEVEVGLRPDIYRVYLYEPPRAVCIFTECNPNVREERSVYFDLYFN